MNATSSDYNIFVEGLYIKNNETILALFVETNRVMFGEINMAKYSFSFKQTLP